MAARAIELEWQGETYVIPESETFEVAEQVEEIIDLADLERFRRNPKFTKIAKCYGVMLRHAGARVSDSEIHQEIVHGAMGDGQEAYMALQAITVMTHLLTSGMPMDDVSPDGDSKKKPAVSSKPASRSRSKATKSRRPNSGG